jgi:hypothetical protein
MCCGAVALADHCDLQYNFSLGTPGPAVTDTFFTPYVSMFRDSDVGSPGTRKLFVGGSFDTIGGVAGTSGIATWDGSAFAPVGNGLYIIDMVGGSPVYSTPQVNAAIEFQGNLYIGGQFDGTDTGVVSRGAIRWTGTQFESINNQDVDVGAYVVNAFAIYKGELYAGGNFPGMGTASAPAIARYDPVSNDWSAVAGSAPTTAGTNVFDLQVYNDGTGEKLYACGNFAQMGGMGSTTKHIAVFDGTSWAAVGGGYLSSGPSAYPRDFVVFDDGSGPALYAAGGLGLIGAGNTTFSAVNRWNGKSWQPMAGFLDNPSVTSATMNSIGLYNDGTGTTMLAQVRFFGSSIGGLPRIARFENGRFNEITPSVIGDTSTSAIFEMFQYDDGSGSKLYIGGNFTSINGAAANRIATITGCTPVGSSCPADFDHSGGLAVADIFAFLNAWFAGCP